MPFKFPKWRRTKELSTTRPSQRASAKGASMKVAKAGGSVRGGRGVMATGGPRQGRRFNRI